MYQTPSGEADSSLGSQIYTNFPMDLGRNYCTH